MDVRFRPARAEDLAVCLEIAPFPSHCDTHDLTQLHPKWSQLLQENFLHMTVFEHFPPAFPPCLTAFALACFVTDVFAQEVKRKLAPPVTLENLLDSAFSRTSPLLPPQQIAQSNAEGTLTMLFLTGVDNTLPPEAILPLRACLTEALFIEYRGYHLKEFLANVHGEEDLRWLLYAGTYLRHSYERYYQENALPLPDYRERPFLLGITREEVAGKEGSTMAALFAYTPPRLFLKPLWQAVLRLALDEHSDEEIAAELQLSINTLKKRWSAMYAHIAAIDATLLCARRHSGSGETTQNQKRRMLAQYLRQHPEELRPYLAP